MNNIFKPLKPKEVDGTLCGQCNSNIDIDTCLFTTSCGHKFHTHCCETWFSNNDECPTCSQTVISTDVRWKCTTLESKKSNTLMEYLFSKSVKKNVHRMLLLSKYKIKSNNIFYIIFCSLFFLSHKLSKEERKIGNEALNYIDKLARIAMILFMSLNIFSDSTVVDKIVFFLFIASYDVIRGHCQFSLMLFKNNGIDSRFFLMFILTKLFSVVLYVAPIYCKYKNRNSFQILSLESFLFTLFMLRLITSVVFYYEFIIYYYDTRVNKFIDLVNKNSDNDDISNNWCIFLLSVTPVNFS